MMRSHNNHTYPADKMFPKETIKRCREDVFGNKLKKHNSAADIYVKHFHTKKCRQWSKKLIEEYRD